ncbi:MAG: DUF1289 domain-containing protein [Burkholderiales bacterium]
MGKPATNGVPSPCISVCAIDEATGLCAGCLRTLDEIAAWSVLDDGERRDVWVRIGVRRAQAGARAARPQTNE